MNTKEYLAQVAYLTSKEIHSEQIQVYKSKFDDSYITHLGLEDTIKFLADREITEQLTHGVGFSPKENKWYGWSHRAIDGFTIGSICRKGDRHYIGESEEAQKQDAIAFWQDEYHINVRCIGIVQEGKDRFFDIKWAYTDTVPNKKLWSTIGGVQHFITPLGKGEWTAKTMEDTKQMAIDFNAKVS